MATKISPSEVRAARADFSSAPHDAFFDEKTVAAFLRVSPAKLGLDRLRDVGIPYHKFGTSIRYRKSDVLSYVAARRHGIEASATGIAGQEAA